MTLSSYQLKLIYDFHTKVLPIDLMKLFTMDSDIHDHDTRYSKYLLHIPEINSTTYGNNSIKFHGPSIWNELIRNGFSIETVNNP